jgi:hypothetical protein
MGESYRKDKPAQPDVYATAIDRALLLWVGELLKKSAFVLQDQLLHPDASASL